MAGSAPREHRALVDAVFDAMLSGARVTPRGLAPRLPSVSNMRFEAQVVQQLPERDQDQARRHYADQLQQSGWSADPARARHRYIFIDDLLAANSDHDLRALLLQGIHSATGLYAPMSRVSLGKMDERPCVAANARAQLKRCELQIQIFKAVQAQHPDWMGTRQVATRLTAFEMMVRHAMNRA